MKLIWRMDDIPELAEVPATERRAVFAKALVDAPSMGETWIALVGTLLGALLVVVLPSPLLVIVAMLLLAALMVTAIHLHHIGAARKVLRNPRVESALADTFE